METLLLVLKIVSVVCVLYIIVKAFQDSIKWGFFFLFSSVIYYFLTGYVGPLVAGAIVIGLMIYYVKNNWKDVGIPFVILVAVWAIQQALPRFT